jgi:hypothetical protein
LLDAGCDDTFSSSGISVVSCASNSCSKAKSSGAGVQTVARGCGSGVSTGCTGTSVLGVSATYCECTTDLCNTAAPVVTVTSLVGLTAAAALAAAVAVVRAIWVTFVLFTASSIFINIVKFITFRQNVSFYFVWMKQKQNNRK